MGGAVFPEESGSLGPTSFCSPRPKLPVTPGLSWLPTFASLSSVMKRTSFHHLMLHYGRGNGDHCQKDLCQRIQDCCIQCCWPRGRPLLTHASTGDAWTLTGMFSSVSGEITAPFSWVPVHTRFCLCPPRVKSLFPQSRGSSAINSSRVKFPGGSQSLCQISRLGNLLWALELSHQCENFFV